MHGFLLLDIFWSVFREKMEHKLSFTMRIKGTSGIPSKILHFNQSILSCFKLDQFWGWLIALVVWFWFWLRTLAFFSLPYTILFLPLPALRTRESFTKTAFTLHWQDIYAVCSVNSPKKCVHNHHIATEKVRSSPIQADFLCLCLPKRSYLFSDFSLSWTL